MLPFYFQVLKTRERRILPTVFISFCPLHVYDRCLVFTSHHRSHKEPLFQFTFQRSFHTETLSAPFYLLSLSLHSSRCWPVDYSGEQTGSQIVCVSYFEFSWMFDIHRKRSRHVSSDFSLLPLLLSLFLPHPLYRRRSERWEVLLPIPLNLCLPFSTSCFSFHFTFSSWYQSPCILFICMVQHLSCFLSLSSLLISFFKLFVFLQYFFWIIFFSPPSAPVSASPVGLFPCLTVLFLPAVLSGVFQTFGACQEPPGLARLSPAFIAIRSNTGTRSSVSSQQQHLQEDKLAAWRLADLQTVKFPSLFETSAVCWLLYC